MKRILNITGKIFLAIMIPVIISVIVTAMAGGDTCTQISENESMTKDIGNDDGHPLISVSGFGNSLQASVSRDRLTILRSSISTEK